MTMTTAQVLRKLRPLLPPTFKRVKPSKDPFERDNIWPGFTDGRLTVEVRGVCSWNATTKERQDCHATRIVARYAAFQYKGLVRQRTWQPTGKAESFNWDGIATAIQGMIPELDAHDERCEAEKAEKVAREKSTESNRKALVRLAKKYGLPTEIVERRNRWTDREERTVGGVQIDVNASHTGCSVKLVDVDLELAELLFELLTPVGERA